MKLICFKEIAYFYFSFRCFTMRIQTRTDLSMMRPRQVFIKYSRDFHSHENRELFLRDFITFSRHQRREWHINCVDFNSLRHSAWSWSSSVFSANQLRSVSRSRSIDRNLEHCTRSNQKIKDLTGKMIHFRSSRTFSELYLLFFCFLTRWFNINLHFSTRRLSSSSRRLVIFSITGFFQLN